MKKQLIYEPMTAITDLIIAGLGIYFAKELFELYGQLGFEVHWHWAFAFLMVAVGAFLGAVSHGIGPHFAPIVKKSIWKLTTLSVGAVAVFFLMTVVYHLPGFSESAWIKWVPIAVYVFYVGVIFNNDQFLNVILFYVPAMILVLAAMLYSQFVLGSPGAGYISIGILISFIGAAVQASGRGFHQHFNHNDIYHVIQMAGMWFFYSGAVRLTDL